MQMSPFFSLQAQKLLQFDRIAARNLDHLAIVHGDVVSQADRFLDAANFLQVDDALFTFTAYVDDRRFTTKMVGFGS